MKLKKFRGSFRFDSCRQRGVATLVVSVGVALLMAVAAVGMMRSGMLEQKIAANDLRMREAQEIAEAGMQYVIVSGSAPGNQCPPDLNLSNNNYIFNEIDLSSVVGVQTTSESYGVSVRWCHKTLSNTKIYFVRSQAEIPSAEAGKDPVVKAFVESWFRKKKDSFLNEINILPPFFVKGDFCPDVVGKKGNNKPSSSCGGNASIGDLEAYNPDYGKWVIASKMANVESLHEKNKQINKPTDAPGGVIQQNEEIKGSAWEYAFNITLDEAKYLALKNPGEPFYYFGSSNVNSKFGNEPLGSKTNPIVLIIEKDSKGKCPNVQLDVYGVVYINGPCDENGWGNAKIYGSVISDGSITKLTGNPTFYKFDATLWSGLVGSAGFIVPGTWRDFEPEPQP